MTALARQAFAGHRRALLAKIHLGAKELRLDEDTRRDLLERVTGCRSSSNCTDAQLVAVIDEYRRQGWKPSVMGKPAGNGAKPAPFPKDTRKPASSPVAKKARAIWISLHQLGVVRDPSDRALEAFGKRQLGVDRLQWADEGTAFRLIEALKAMAERAGWSQDLADVPSTRRIWTLKARLVNAQRRLLGLGPATDLSAKPEAELDLIARKLATQLQALKPAND